MTVRGRLFVSARIRAGSKFKRFLCFVLIDVRCFRLRPGVSVFQDEDHCPRVYFPGLIHKSTLNRQHSNNGKSSVGLYLLLSISSQHQDCFASDDMINENLERICKEEAVV
jgi:hypothetical protein